MPMRVTSEIGCNTTFIVIRDEGGLVCPTIYAVHVCGIMIELFQLLLSNENIYKAFIENSSNARSGLMAIRNVCDETIKMVYGFLH